MNKIVKVIIKGTSGYCSIEDEYKEKITIGQNKVKYHFLPEVVNVPPPIEAGASCFSENSTIDSEELWCLTHSPQA